MGIIPASMHWVGRRARERQGFRTEPIHRSGRAMRRWRRRGEPAGGSAAETLVFVLARRARRIDGARRATRHRADPSRSRAARAPRARPTAAVRTMPSAAATCSHELALSRCGNDTTSTAPWPRASDVAAPAWYHGEHATQSARLRCIVLARRGAARRCLRRRRGCSDGRHRAGVLCSVAHATSQHGGCRRPARNATGCSGRA